MAKFTFFLARRFRLARLVVVAMASACGGEQQSVPYVVRDSGSVRIVENASPLWTDSTSWRVEVNPHVAIGVVEGAPEYQLFRVRHAVRLDDGMIVLADGGSRELRLYDPEGRHIRSTGGAGEGPGEFRVLSLLSRFGPDSLAIYDGQLQRVSILDRNGVLGRTFRRPDIGRYVSVHGYFDDGALLGSVDQGVSLDTVSAGVLRAHSVLFRTIVGGAVDTIGRFFCCESYVKKTADRASMSSMPYSRRAVLTIDGDRFHFSTTDTYEVHTYTSGGTLLRIVRMHRANAPLTGRDIDAYIAAATSRIGDPQQRREFEASTREMPHAATLPALSAMMVDTEGHLWIADYHLQDHPQQQWTIFDPNGRLLGWLTTPPGLTITDIGSNYVLGVRRDDLNVEQVVLHALIKPSG